jgi:pimeloyl-ACP methyl ester carboxylesterase
MPGTETVVLLHSSASSGAQWRALAERLRGSYRVVAPDLYGYGGAPQWPGRGPFTLADEAWRVHGVLEGIGEPAHLVGHSYGGAVALRVARTRPGALLSLTLIEPVSFHLLSDRREIAAVADKVARALANGDYSGGMAAFVDYWSGPGSWDALPAGRRDPMAARLGKVALDFNAAFGERALPGEYRRVGVPTLLIQGARSPAPTRRICELLAGILPLARLRIVEGAGHMAPLTHPGAVNELVAAHLSSQLEEVSHAA